MGKDTHYAGCWKDYRHHGCAVRRIERLEELLRECCEYLEEGDEDEGIRAAMHTLCTTIYEIIGE